MWDWFASDSGCSWSQFAAVCLKIGASGSLETTKKHGDARQRRTHVPTQPLLFQSILRRVVLLAPEMYAQVVSWGLSLTAHSRKWLLRGRCAYLKKLILPLVWWRLVLLTNFGLLFFLPLWFFASFAAQESMDSLAISEARGISRSKQIETLRPVSCLCYVVVHILAADHTYKKANMVSHVTLSHLETVLSPFVFIWYNIRSLNSRSRWKRVYILCNQLYWICQIKLRQKPLFK